MMKQCWTVGALFLVVPLLLGTSVRGFAVDPQFGLRLEFDGRALFFEQC